MEWQEWVAVVETMAGLVLTGFVFREASDAYDDGVSPWEFITFYLQGE